MSHVSRVTNLVLLGLVGTALLLAGARANGADDKEPEKALTAEQRAELEKEWRRLNAEGYQCFRDGRLREAVSIQERALAACEKLYPKQDHSDLANTLNAMGFLLNSLGEPRKALPYYERALAMRERLYPKQDHPDLAFSLHNLGFLLNSLGEPQKALPYYERTLAMRERLYDKQDHPQLAISLSHLGGVLYSLGEPRKALPHWERALAMYERTLPQAGPLRPGPKPEQHGLCAGRPGRAAQGAGVLRAGPGDLRAPLPQEGPPPTGQQPEQNGPCAELAGASRAGGLPYFERVLDMEERLHPKQDHSELAASLNNMGVVLNSLDEPRKALPFYERALAMCERLYPKKDHPNWPSA